MHGRGRFGHLLSCHSACVGNFVGRFFRALQIAEKSAGPSTAAVMFYLYGLTCDKRNTNTSVLYSRIFFIIVII